MNVLIVGSGGREHALLRTCLKSPQVKKIFVAPGNPGMQEEERVRCVDIRATDINNLLEFSTQQKIDLCLVGPESSLSLGIVDKFKKNSIPIFGPDKSAAALEFSKSFAKKIMKKAKVQTAKHYDCDNLKQAFSVIKKFSSHKMVVKANGLAAGKGVFICEKKEQAYEASKYLFETGHESILIEKLLQGREISAFAICDGTHAVSLGLACDYKRIYDFDKGPNTGGMGAYSPVDWAEEALAQKIQIDVFDKIMKRMKIEGKDFRGILYAGLMVKKDELDDWDINVIEFNTRFGDPESQVLLPLVNEDLIPWFLESATSKFSKSSIQKKRESAVHLVLAAQGYPGLGGNQIKKGDIISIGDFNNQDELLYFAGVKKEKGHYLTDGGRVMGVTCLDKNRMLARLKTYQKIKDIQFSGAQRRDDIGL